MVPDTKKTASHFIINYVKANFWILIKEELHILTKVTWLLTVKISYIPDVWQALLQHWLYRSKHKQYGFFHHEK